MVEPHEFKPAAAPATVLEPEGTGRQRRARGFHFGDSGHGRRRPVPAAWQPWPSFTSSSSSTQERGWEGDDVVCGVEGGKAAWDLTLLQDSSRGRGSTAGSSGFVNRAERTREGGSWTSEVGSASGAEQLGELRLVAELGTASLRFIGEADSGKDDGVAARRQCAQRQR